MMKRRTRVLSGPAAALLGVFSIRACGTQPAGGPGVEDAGEDALVVAEAGGSTDARPDHSVTDAESDALEKPGADAGIDAAEAGATVDAAGDAKTDSAADGEAEAGEDASVDAGHDAATGTDSGVTVEAGADSGQDAGGAGAADAGHDAGGSATVDAAGDAAVDAAAGGGGDGGHDASADAPIALDAMADAAIDAATVVDATADTGGDAAVLADATADAVVDSGHDAGLDATAVADSGHDGGIDATAVVDGGGVDAETDATLGADGGSDAGLDAHIDAANDGGADAGCTSSVAIVGGSSSGAFAAQWHGGAWTTAEFGDASVVSTPTVVALGGGWLAVAQANGGNLIYSEYATGTWSVPADIGSATTAGAPALTTLDGDGQLVYLGSNTYYYHGTFAAGVWDSAGDPVGGASSQDEGPAAPSVASVGTSIYTAFVGENGDVYVSQFNGTSWQPAVQVATSVTNTTPPTIIALTGGSDDLMVVFASYPNTDLEYVVRDGTSHAWSGQQLIKDATVYTAYPVALAPLPNGGAYLLYEGGDFHPYQATYAAGAWSSVTALLAVQPTLASAPQVAAGICGDEVESVFVDTDGGVHVVRITGGTVTDDSPSALTGTFAGIATTP